MHSRTDWESNNFQNGGLKAMNNASGDCGEAQKDETPLSHRWCCPVLPLSRHGDDRSAKKIEYRKRGKRGG